MSEDKYIFFDANAFYEYFGRNALLGTQSSIQYLQYIADVDKYKHKFLPSSVLTEILVHFRNNLKKIQDIFYFIAKKNIKIVPIGTKGYTTEELEKFFGLSACKKTKYLKKELENKIDTETRFSYLFMLSISIVYALYIAEPLNIDLAAFSQVFGKFLRDKYYEEDLKTLKQELKVGYKKNKEVKALKDSFTNRIYRNFGLAHGLVLNITNNPINITEEILERELEIVIQTLGNDSKEIMNVVKKTSKNNVFVNEAIKHIPSYFAKKGYRDIQIEYIKEKYSSWLNDGQKLIKNDIYDILFLGALADDVCDNLSYILKRNVSKDDIIVLSFDKKVIEHINKYSPDSYSFCKKYAPHLT